MPNPLNFAPLLQQKQAVPSPKTKPTPPFDITKAKSSDEVPQDFALQKGLSLGWKMQGSKSGHGGFSYKPPYTNNEYITSGNITKEGYERVFELTPIYANVAKAFGLNYDSARMVLSDAGGIGPNDVVDALYAWRHANPAERWLYRAMTLHAIGSQKNIDKVVTALKQWQTQEHPRWYKEAGIEQDVTKALKQLQDKNFVENIRKQLHNVQEPEDLLKLTVPNGP